MFTPVPGTTYPISEATPPPMDGQMVLVYGTAGWERLDRHTPDKRWHLVVWEPDLTYDYDSEDDVSIGGWKTVTSNPYKDYVLGTHWQLCPAEPV
ncbi:MAG: hypothetical protein EOP83_07945 [Verrucomicrobiaceae bacterium]|nr:MAG: hypothetical protein EOP83_07945 [Verrucomicrobiaceae bacterium]